MLKYFDAVIPLRLCTYKNSYRVYQVQYNVFYLYYGHTRGEFISNINRNIFNKLVKISTIL